MNRETQIKNLSDIITALRLPGYVAESPINATELAQSIRNYAGDCFDAWYCFRPNGDVVGRIQNDNCVAFYKKIIECMEDVGHVCEYGTKSYDDHLARLLTRWVKINDFAI